MCESELLPKLPCQKSKFRKIILWTDNQCQFVAVGLHLERFRNNFIRNTNDLHGSNLSISTLWCTFVSQKKLSWLITDTRFASLCILHDGEKLIIYTYQQCKVMIVGILGMSIDISTWQWINTCMVPTCIAIILGAMNMDK